jgi:hypothetical protein
MAKTISAKTVQVTNALMYDHSQSIAEIARRSGVEPKYVAQVLNENMDKIIVSRSFDGKHNEFRLNPAKEITRKLTIVHDPGYTNLGKKYNFKKGTVAIHKGNTIPLDGLGKVAFRKWAEDLDGVLIQYPLKRA